MDNDEEENPTLALDDSEAKSKDAGTGAEYCGNEVVEVTAQLPLAEAEEPHSLPAVGDDAAAADSFGEAADGGSQSVSAEASASDDEFHSSGNKGWA